MKPTILSRACMLLPGSPFRYLPPCPVQHVPEEVDLILIDTTTTSSSPASVEWVIRRFIETKSEPLIILVSNTKVLQRL